MEDQLTEEHRENLRNQIAKWLDQVFGKGSMHTAWEYIADAQALLDGRPTFFPEKTVQENYQLLMEL
jgi:hypothetical protein